MCVKPQQRVPILPVLSGLLFFFHMASRKATRQESGLGGCLLESSPRFTPGWLWAMGRSLDSHSLGGVQARIISPNEESEFLQLLQKLKQTSFLKKKEVSPLKQWDPGTQMSQAALSPSPLCVSLNVDFIVPVPGFVEDEILTTGNSALRLNKLVQKRMKVSSGPVQVVKTLGL